MTPTVFNTDAPMCRRLCPEGDGRAAAAPPGRTGCGAGGAQASTPVEPACYGATTHAAANVPPQQQQQQRPEQYGSQHYNMQYMQGGSINSSQGSAGHGPADSTTSGGGSTSIAHRPVHATPPGAGNNTFLPPHDVQPAPAAWWAAQYSHMSGPAPAAYTYGHYQQPGAEGQLLHAGSNNSAAGTAHMAPPPPLEWWAMPAPSSAAQAAPPTGGVEPAAAMTRAYSWPQPGGSHSNGSGAPGGGALDQHVPGLVPQQTAYGWQLMPPPVSGVPPLGVPAASPMHQRCVRPRYDDLSPPQQHYYPGAAAGMVPAGSQMYPPNGLYGAPSQPPCTSRMHL